MIDTKTNLHITTLGRFDLQKDNQSLFAQSTNAKKIWDLFKFMFTYRDKTFTPESLVDQLWTSESYSDPRGSLRRQMHRLRQLLGESSDAHEHQLIHFTGGSYRWNQQCQLTTDIDEFESLIKAGETLLLKPHSPSPNPNPNSHSPSPNSAPCALECFQKAIALYNGDYLPDCTDQHWVFAVRHHYRRLYLKAVTHTLELLKNLGNFDAMITTAGSAIQIDLYEEHFHLMYMEALLQKGNTKQALEHYEHITRFFYQEMGIAPSADFKLLYKRLLAAPSNTAASPDTTLITATSLDTTLDTSPDTTLDTSPDIIAALDDHAPIQNAFYCDPFVFKSIYELERRRSQRSGQQFSVAILTTSLITSDTLAQDSLRLENFKNHLAQHLRLGDTFARWGDHQYVALLPGVDETLTTRVFERVLANYHDKQAITIERINHLPPLSNTIEIVTGGYLENQFKTDVTDSPY